MKSRYVVLSLLVLCMVLVPSPLLAKGWYLGGEFQLSSLGDSIVEDIDNGYGLGLDFGYRFSPRFALDFTWAMSFHDENGNDVEYMRFLGGGKLIFNYPEQLQPYLTLGFEDNIIFRSILDDIDGSGFYVGFGGDYYLNEKTSIDVSLKHSMWTGEIDIPSTSEDVTTDTLSISYKHHFVK